MLSPLRGSQKNDTCHRTDQGSSKGFHLGWSGPSDFRGRNPTVQIREAPSRTVEHLAHGGRARRNPTVQIREVPRTPLPCAHGFRRKRSQSHRTDQGSSKEVRICAYCLSRAWSQSHRTDQGSSKRSGRDSGPSALVPTVSIPPDRPGRVGGSAPCGRWPVAPGFNPGYGGLDLVSSSFRGGGTGANKGIDFDDRHLLDELRSSDCRGITDIPFPPAPSPLKEL